MGKSVVIVVDLWSFHVEVTQESSRNPWFSNKLEKSNTGG